MPVMKRTVALTLLLAGIASTGFAQHGGGHGGSGGHAGGSAHAGSAFHSGFGATAHPSAPAYGQRYGASRPSPYAGGAPSPRNALHPGNSLRYGAQPLNYGARGAGVAQGEHRSPYRGPYRRPERGGVIYENPYAGFGGYYAGYPYGLGYYGDDGFDDNYANDSGDTAQSYPGPDQYNGFDPQAGADPSAQAQDWPPPDQGQGVAELEPGTPYRPYYGVPAPEAHVANQPVVTLVFKDHRPNEQIRNYLINGDKLTVWDQRPHEIALDQLDIGATEKLNHDAGVDLYLPGAPR